MTDFVLTKSPLVAPRRWTVVCVPPDVQATAMDSLGHWQTSAAAQTFAQFVSTRFLPDLNKLTSNGVAQMYATVQAGSRTIYFLLTTSPLLASAPALMAAAPFPPTAGEIADFVANVAALSTDHTQAFVTLPVSMGDTWFVAQRVDGLRHAAFGLLQQNGVIYAGPHPSMRMIPTVHTPDYVIYETESPTRCVTRTPLVSYLFGSGEGGFALDAQPPTPYVRANIRLWMDDWWFQIRAPSEHGIVSGDNTENAMQRLQCKLRADRSMLAWIPVTASGAALNKRGWNSTNFDFPLSCAAADVFLAKFCVTHHGNGGAFPAAPLTTPWAGLTIGALPCTLATNPADCVETAQNPALDSSAYIDPSGTPYTFSDYAGNGGLYKLVLDDLRNVAGSRQDATDPAHPSARFVTSEGTDGAWYCYDDHCVALLRQGPYAFELLGENTGIKNTGTSPAVTASGILGNAANFKIQYLSNTTMKVSLNGGLDGYPYNPVAIPKGSTYTVPTSALVLSFLVGTYVNGDTCTIADATDGDKQAHFSGAIQRGLNDWWQHTPQYTPGTGWASYTSHAQIPSVPLEPRNGLSVVDTSGPSDFGGYTEREFYGAWQDKRASNQRGPFHLGNSTYENTASENWSQPQFPSGYQTFEKFKHCLDGGMGFYSAQTEHGALNIGLNFYMHGKQCWQGDLTAEAVTAEWFSILGPAAAQIRAMYDRWTAAGGSFHYCQDEWADSFRNLQAAQADLDAAPNPVTSERYAYDGSNQGSAAANARYNVQFRLNMWTMLVEWHRLCGDLRGFEHLMRTDPSIANQNILAATLEAMQWWGWRCEQTEAAHFDQAIQRLLQRNAAIFGDNMYNGGRTGSGSTLTTAPSLIRGGVVDSSITIWRAECTTGGLRDGTAKLRWSIDGGATWVASNVTITATMNFVVGAHTMTMAFPGGSLVYSTNFVWTYHPAMAALWNFQDTNPAHGPHGGWGSSAFLLPDTAELTALVNTRVSAITPVAGMTRRNSSSKNFRVFNQSASATTVQSWQLNASRHHSFVIHLAGGPQSLTLRCISGGSGGSKSNYPIRVRLLELSGLGADLEVHNAPRAGNVGGATLDTVVTFNQPAGFYLMRVQSPLTSDALIIIAAKSFPLSWMCDPPEGRQASLSLFNDTKDIFFYVPTGETLIRFAFKTIRTIQFFDDLGASVATTHPTGWDGNPEPFIWQATVAAGRSGKIWKFRGLCSSDSIAYPMFQNCPNLFAPSAEQIIVPVEFP